LFVGFEDSFIDRQIAQTLQDPFSPQHAGGDAAFPPALRAARDHRNFKITSDRSTAETEISWSCASLMT